MLLKTQGIVFRNVRYGETSLIVDIYCQEVGLQSYIINGARKVRSSMPASLFQVMSCLDLVVYHSDKHGLKRIKEVSVHTHYRQIHQDIRASSVGVFLIEVIRSAVPLAEPNADLYDFVSGAFQRLDDTKEGFAILILTIMVELTGFLGFFPGGEWSSPDSIFDMREGRFSEDLPPYPEYLNGPTAQLLHVIRQNDVRTSAAFPMDTYRKLLQGMLAYYQLHLDHFKIPSSMEILRQVI